EAAWRQALHDGVIAGTAYAPKKVAARAAPAITRSSDQPITRSLEIVFRPDPTIHDGRFANNGWLQEMPKPITKLTWDNALLLSPETAKRIGVAGEEVVRLTYGGRSLEGPVWILPGHAEDAATLHLRYGMTW